MQTSHLQPKILLAGNGPYANRGCEAIVRGTVELLSRKFGDVSFILSSFGATLAQEAAAETDPRIEHRPHVEPRVAKRFDAHWWRSRLGLAVEEKPVPFSVQVQAMAECQCALMLGGDNYSLDYGRPTSFIEMNDALLASGKPVVLWGASVGPFTKDPEFEVIMRDHLQKLQLILVRETDSFAYLDSIGVNKNVRLVGDPAFVMSEKQPQLSDRISGMLNGGAIGLNLSPLVGIYLDGGMDAWRETAGKCVRALVESDLGPVLLLPHVTINTPIDNDYAFLAGICSDLPGVGERFDILPPTLSAQEYKWVIARMRGFAGARMHATVAALSSFVPTLSLGYSMKSRGINQDLFGHLDWLVTTDELTPELLVAKFSALLDNKDSITDALRTNLPAMTSRAEAAGDYIVELLAGRTS